MSSQWSGEARHLFIVGVIDDWNDKVYRCFLRDALWSAFTQCVFYESRTNIGTSSTNAQGHKKPGVWIPTACSMHIFHRTINRHAEFRSYVYPNSEHRSVEKYSDLHPFVCSSTSTSWTDKKSLMLKKNTHYTRMPIYKKNNCLYNCIYNLLMIQIKL